MKTVSTLCVALLVLAISGCVRYVRRLPQTKADIEGIHKAIQSYYTDYRDYPTGDTQTIIRTLTGTNQRHVVYIEFPASRTASDGSYLDFWGTPFRVIALPPAFPAPSVFQISSAGPDRVFGTGDDIVVTTELK